MSCRRFQLYLAIALVALVPGVRAAFEGFPLEDNTAALYWDNIANLKVSKQLWEATDERVRTMGTNGFNVEDTWSIWSSSNGTSTITTTNQFDSFTFMGKTIKPTMSRSEIAAVDAALFTMTPNFVSVNEYSNGSYNAWFARSYLTSNYVAESILVTGNGGAATGALGRYPKNGNGYNQSGSGWLMTRDPNRSPGEFLYYSGEEWNCYGGDGNPLPNTWAGFGFPGSVTVALDPPHYEIVTNYPHDYPYSTPAEIMLGAKIGFVTNITTNAFGFVTGGDAHFTRQPAHTVDLVMAQAAYGWPDLSGDVIFEGFTNAFIGMNGIWVNTGYAEDEITGDVVGGIWEGGQYGVLCYSAGSETMELYYYTAVPPSYAEIDLWLTGVSEGTADHKQWSLDDGAGQSNSLSGGLSYFADHKWKSHSLSPLAGPGYNLDYPVNPEAHFYSNSHPVIVNEFKTNSFVSNGVAVNVMADIYGWILVVTNQHIIPFEKKGLSVPVGTTTLEDKWYMVRKIDVTSSGSPVGQTIQMRWPETEYFGNMPFVIYPRDLDERVKYMQKLLYTVEPVWAWTNHTRASYTNSLDVTNSVIEYNTNYSEAYPWEFIVTGTSNQYYWESYASNDYQFSWEYQLGWTKGTQTWTLGHYTYPDRVQWLSDQNNPPPASEPNLDWWQLWTQESGWDKIEFPDLVVGDPSTNYFGEPYQSVYWAREFTNRVQAIFRGAEFPWEFNYANLGATVAVMGGELHGTNRPPYDYVREQSFSQYRKYLKDFSEAVGASIWTTNRNYLSPTYEFYAYSDWPATKRATSQTSISPVLYPELKTDFPGLTNMGAMFGWTNLSLASVPVPYAGYRTNRFVDINRTISSNYYIQTSTVQVAYRYERDMVDFVLMGWDTGYDPINGSLVPVTPGIWREPLWGAVEVWMNGGEWNMESVNEAPAPYFAAVATNLPGPWAWYISEPLFPSNGVTLGTGNYSEGTNGYQTTYHASTNTPASWTNINLVEVGPFVNITSTKPDLPYCTHPLTTNVDCIYRETVVTGNTPWNQDVVEGAVGDRYYSEIERDEVSTYALDYIKGTDGLITNRLSGTINITYTNYVIVEWYDRDLSYTYYDRNQYQKGQMQQFEYNYNTTLHGLKVLKKWDGTFLRK